ncbi:pilus assembly protein [Novosphingobium sp. M1R2S20]|uniref:Pilus assembly protein n=1 Tax=Novosphingobium rhizovicinum TaxID=3228928 RepID=A0ABV3RBT4_9SPHN
MMPRLIPHLRTPRWSGWFGGLAAEQRGNTFVIVSAALIPMLALIGGGIDMGRAYLTQTRLQQACDAGVLAARKELGSAIIADGTVPSIAATVGNRFFNVNFQDGAYGSESRSFAMTLGSDYTINGTASAIVPTTIMRLFGSLQVPVSVKCSAQFNYANTDIMMVLDVTGSMNSVNSGDTKSRIAVLRDVVRNFHKTVETNKAEGVRVRYGFVPYSTNVNVGFLLKSGWMVNRAQYEGRRAIQPGPWYSPNGTWRYESLWQDVSSLKGSSGETLYKGGSISVPMNGTPSSPSNAKMTFSGCIEERATYIIDDYSNVDLSRARDLDIDAVPASSNPDTQWRPMLREMSWLRAQVNYWFVNSYWSPSPVDSTTDYIQASAYGFAACPERARKLAEMNATEVSNYVNALTADGNTYHDIGMIWGGRLLSPTGLFASENADVDGRTTMRHLIFLTDGETAPLDLSYSSYGVEPLAQRRWKPGSKYTLTQTVENRFTFACNEVKNRNITVWVIGFGTNMTSMLRNCAGSGRWFQADNASELTKAFGTIAAAIGDLRIVE